MAIAINGSGTITGISVGGIPDGTVDTDVLAANAVTYAKIGTTEQGQLCKAWVNFDGTGTPSIRASYNVSSITDNGTGDYTVNFTSALADANYCANVTCDGASAVNSARIPTTYSLGSTSAVRINFYNPIATVFQDPAVVNVAIFR